MTTEAATLDPHLRENPLFRRVIFTGKMRSGKDYISEKLGLTVLPLAEPLYEICASMLGRCDKGIPSHRLFLQMLGSWGRGEEKPEDPTLPSKAEVIERITTRPETLVSEKHIKLPVNWNAFGVPTFWMDIAILKTQAFIKANPETRISVPNGRFKNEVEAFQRLGFLHLHIKCSEEERLKRLGPNHHPEHDKDVTEEYAEFLDHTLLGPTVIWNDHRPVPPNTGWWKMF